MIIEKNQVQWYDLYEMLLKIMMKIYKTFPTLCSDIYQYIFFYCFNCIIRKIKNKRNVSCRNKIIHDQIKRRHHLHKF